MREIFQIVYTSEAGTILPELRWYERISITRDKLLLARNGAVVSTHVNVGVWSWAANEPAVAALFEQLATVDCATIKRVKPDDPPDGGHSESYTVVYAKGNTCSLLYNPGVSYINGDLIVQPVLAFIRGLSLPDEAASRYKFAAP